MFVKFEIWKMSSALKGMTYSKDACLNTDCIMSVEDIGTFMHENYESPGEEKIKSNFCFIILGQKNEEQKLGYFVKGTLEENMKKINSSF